MTPETDETLGKNDRLEEAILAILKAIDAGEKPVLEEYVARYPDLAEEIAQFCQGQTKLRQFLNPPPKKEKTTADWNGNRHSPWAIGKYEILHELARGGMGVVYKARDVELSRIVALKVIKPERFPDETARQRFKTEAQSVAKLEHSNIVRIWDYDAGEADGCPRIAMEFVEGSDLAAMHRQNSLPPGRAAALVAAIADAVEYAHQRGVIHRDLKCANVLLTKDGTPKIADFGLARNLMPSDGQVTESGAKLGSPAYMSPEQAAGDGKAIGPVTDVFGLGAVLYELLTGRSPFHGQSTKEVLEQARQGNVTPPRQFNPKIPKSLEKICLTALAAEPDQRYASAAAFAAALRRYAAWPRRVLMGVAGVAGVAMLVGIAAAIFYWPTAEPLTANTQNREQFRGTLKREHQVLTAELQILLWSGDGCEKRGEPITDEGVLPARSGDQVLIKAKMNQPAYIYLIWLDTKGGAVALYPWNHTTIEQDLFADPPHQSPQKEVFSPTVALDEGKLKGWKLDENPGLETILLLASHKPLPPQTRLAKLIGNIPASPLRDKREWGKLAMFRDSDENNLLRQGQYRGPEREAVDVDHGMLEVLNRLRGHFDVVQAVRFAHAQQR